MTEKPQGPTVNAYVVEIAQEHFRTIQEAREALHRAVDDIAEDQLRRARGIQVLVMA